MNKPTKNEMLNLIRHEIINCDGVSDEEYLAWKEILRIVKEYEYKESE